MSDSTTDRAALERELAELGAANAAATSWGAALGARHERMVAIQAELRQLDAKPADAATIRNNTSEHIKRADFGKSSGAPLPQSADRERRFLTAPIDAAGYIDMSADPAPFDPVMLILEGHVGHQITLTYVRNILQRVREEAAAAERAECAKVAETPRQYGHSQEINITSAQGITMNGCIGAFMSRTPEEIAAAIRARGTGTP